MSVLEGKELALRAVSVSPDDLVMIKHHLEASEGLGFLVADRGGDAFLVAHRTQSAALDRFIEDLKGEFDLREGIRPAHTAALEAARGGSGGTGRL